MLPAVNSQAKAKDRKEEPGKINTALDKYIKKKIHKTKENKNYIICTKNEEAQKN